jgi:hypothetical protein
LEFFFEAYGLEEILNASGPFTIDVIFKKVEYNLDRKLFWN